MKLSVKHIDNNNLSIAGTLYHDTHGNIYFKITQKENEKYFVLSIGANDDLEWFELNDYALLT